MGPAESIDAGVHVADRHTRRVGAIRGELTDDFDTVLRRGTVRKPTPSRGLIGGREQRVRPDFGGLAQFAEETLKPGEFVTRGVLVGVPQHDGKVVPPQRIADRLAGRVDVDCLPART